MVIDMDTDMDNECPSGWSVQLYDVYGDVSRETPPGEYRMTYS
jgi:hypothetical protein